MSVEFFVRLRDACEAEIERLKPSEAKSLEYDLNNIKTTRTEGPSGFYEKANEQDGEDYRNLLEDLKAHDGKLTRDGMFVWLFSDGKSVGMKPSKK